MLSSNENKNTLNFNYFVIKCYGNVEYEISNYENCSKTSGLFSSFAIFPSFRF